MLSIDAIFNETKEFYKHFLPFKQKYLLESTNKTRNKTSKMPDYQIISVIIMFHLSGYIRFKVFYEEVILKQHSRMFKNAVSYSWFVRLRNQYLFDLQCFLTYKKHKIAQCRYIDSTPIKVCNARRINNHKVFKGLAQRGHHSMGWFFGFKLHIIINENGEILSYKVTTGEKNDRVGFDMAKGFEGYLCGDKGYLSKEWEKKLSEMGIKLITKKRKNMKEKQHLTSKEKFYLRGRGIIETVIGQLKNMRLENSGLRSFAGFMISVMGCLLAYALKPTKPSLRPFKQNLIRT